MAAVTRAKTMPPNLVASLADPGMTPWLRAGLGGLAAALRAISLGRDPRSAWPAPVDLGPGEARVEPRRITISWGGKPPAKTLEALFEECFRIRKPHGIIDIRGTYEPGQPPRDDLASALQNGLKKTVLQHGKYTPKSGSPKTLSFELDGETHHAQVQGYASFVHQKAWEKIERALRRGRTELAGWAYPGAAQRHIAFGDTKCAYSAAQALCGCFALTGCLAYEVPRSGGGGALVILEPSDLVLFAVTRPRLSPRRLVDAYTTGPGDALLAVHLAIRLDDAIRDRPGVARAHAVALRPMPWAKQQKSRALTLSVGAISEERLDSYDVVVRALPARILDAGAPSESGETDDDGGTRGYFAAMSALRGFVTENLARGRPWFVGFATYRDAEGRGLGTLYPSERRGLIAMLEQLEEAEAILVRSVHVALRQRFGAIAEEFKDNPVRMKNKFQDESDRWRYAFAGSKTPEQIRAALASLWSRAGPNSELRESWERLLPLLRDDLWQTARDLALVALASYQGAGASDDTTPSGSARTSPVSNERTSR